VRAKIQEYCEGGAVMSESDSVSLQDRFQTGVPLKALSQQEKLKEKVNQVLKTLTYREREIVKLRYGLGDGYTYTLKEVARIFKVEVHHVRQIQAKAERKLQHPVRQDRLAEFRDTLATEGPTTPEGYLTEGNGDDLEELRPAACAAPRHPDWRHTPPTIVE
jgi:hypothetical protein